MRHPNSDARKYYEPCEITVCHHCRKRKKHKTLSVRTEYKTMRQQHRGPLKQSEMRFFFFFLHKKQHNVPE